MPDQLFGLEDHCAMGRKPGDDRPPHILILKAPVKDTDISEPAKSIAARAARPNR